ncbi:MAG: hypothetical protein WBM51_07675, partial [Pseudolabrys sp.]
WEAYFDHDYIFVFDSNNRLIYSLVDHRPADAKWLAAARPELTPVIDFMRGRDQHPRGAIRLNQMNPPDTGKLP